MLMFLTQYTTLVCISWWWLHVSAENILEYLFINTDQCKSFNTWTTVSNLIQVLTNKLNRSKALYLGFRRNYLHSQWISNRIFSQYITSRKKEIKILTRLTWETVLSLARRSQAELIQCLLSANQTMLPAPGLQGLDEETLLSMKMIKLRPKFKL